MPQSCMCCTLQTVVAGITMITNIFSQKYKSNNHYRTYFWDSLQKCIGFPDIWVHITIMDCYHNQITILGKALGNVIYQTFSSVRNCSLKFRCRFLVYNSFSVLICQNLETILKIFESSFKIYNLYPIIFFLERVQNDKSS